MRVLICGSRDWTDPAPIEQVVAGLLPDEWGTMTVIAGGARGADSLAAQAARDFDVRLDEYPAEWNVYGKGAGPIRNQKMLDKGQPDVVWAFITTPLKESRGTADMVMRATWAGIPVYVVSKANLARAS